MNAPEHPLLVDADLERRFGGLRRLYGEAGYLRLRSARVAVVGLGGVGSWAVEALARCGVAELVLVDLDQVAESNINRQVQALSATLGQAKVDALAERIAQIHPGCVVHRVEQFVEAPRRAGGAMGDAAAAPAAETAPSNEPGNWPALLPIDVDVVIDACDQSAAKLAIASHALLQRQALVVVGAAGGKIDGTAVRVDDLANATHDPLLATLRQRLRRSSLAPRQGAIGLRCVFSREAVLRPDAIAEACATVGLPTAAPGMPLACAGYGSTVIVTAAFGLAAAGEAIRFVLADERCA